MLVNVASLVRPPIRRPFARVTLVMLGVLSACGGDGGGTGSDATNPRQSVRYEGVFNSGVDRGVIVIRSGSPAVASLVIGDSAPVSLTGAVTNGRFELSGGGYSVSAAPQGNDALLGTVTGGALRITANLGALTAPDSGVAVRYCGVYTGSDAGMGDLLVRGGQAVASVTGMGGGFSMTGTATATAVNLTFTGKESPNGREATITANLARSGDTVTGRASNTLYPANVTTVVATRGGCRPSTVASPGLQFKFAGVATRGGFMGRIGGEAFARQQPSWVAPYYQWDPFGSNRGGDVFYQSGTGSYDPTTGALAHDAALNFRATVTGNRLTGRVAATNSAGTLALYDQTIFDGLVRDSTDAVGPFCGSASVPGAGRAQMYVVNSGSVALGKLLYFGGRTRLLTGSFGTTWLYLTDGTSYFMAANRTSATATSQTYTGTWSSDDPAVGDWNVSTCR